MRHLVKSGGTCLSLLTFTATAAVLGAMLLLVLVSAPTVRAPVIPPNRGLISIVGDNSFTPANGVNGGGSGTKENPYIIEDRVLDASGANGILIENTTKYFVVRNCSVENGKNYSGIYLDNVINGKVENNACENNGVGIYLKYSDYNDLTGNTCENNSWAGIYLNYSSDNNTLDNNACSNNDNYGIYLNNSFNDTISNNVCLNNDNGNIYQDPSSTGNVLSNNTTSTTSTTPTTTTTTTQPPAGTTWIWVGVGTAIVVIIAVVVLVLKWGGK